MASNPPYPPGFPPTGPMVGPTPPSRPGPPGGGATVWQSYPWTQVRSSGPMAGAQLTGLGGIDFNALLQWMKKLKEPEQKLPSIIQPRQQAAPAPSLNPIQQFDAWKNYFDSLSARGDFRPVEYSAHPFKNVIAAGSMMGQNLAAPSDPWIDLYKAAAGAPSAAAVDTAGQNWLLTSQFGQQRPQQPQQPQQQQEEEKKKG